MAISLNAQTTAGKILATDTVAGAEMEIVKINVGAAGADSLMSATNPLFAQLVAGTANIGAVSLTGSTSAIVTISGTASVQITSFLAPVSLTGSFVDALGNALRVTLGATTMPVSGTVQVQGITAQGSAVAGNPVLNGAEGRTTVPTAVSDGQAVRMQADDLGRLVTVLSGPRDIVSDTLITVTVSTTVTLITAQAANTFADITSIVISNGNAAMTTAIIFDGISAGTQRMVLQLAASGGGAVIPFAVPLKQATAATGWGIKINTTGPVYVTSQFVQNK